MGYCYFCEKEPRENWTGFWCSNCRQIKNLANVYGYDKVLEILKDCCIRNSDQLDRKIQLKRGLKSIEINAKGKIVEGDYNLRSGKPKVEKC